MLNIFYGLPAGRQVPFFAGIFWASKKGRKSIFAKNALLLLYFNHSNPNPLKPLGLRIDIGATFAS